MNSFKSVIKSKKSSEDGMQFWSFQGYVWNV